MLRTGIFVAQAVRRKTANTVTRKADAENPFL
jgi:hypothetical protein